MKVHIDSTKCEGYGTCAEHCPQLIQLDEWGYASVIGDGVVTDGDRDAVAEAIKACPEGAITAT